MSFTKKTKIQREFFFSAKSQSKENPLPEKQQLFSQTKEQKQKNLSPQKEEKPLLQDEFRFTFPQSKNEPHFTIFYLKKTR